MTIYSKTPTHPNFCESSDSILSFATITSKNQLFIKHTWKGQILKIKYSCLNIYYVYIFKGVGTTRNVWLNHFLWVTDSVRLSEWFWKHWILLNNRNVKQ